MGDRLHPNYLFTHTNFHECPYNGMLDYFDDLAFTSSETFRCLVHGTQNTIKAANMTHRTQVQENLRTEMHHEVTMARLESVSVGKYRYYQGHLNIEEYKSIGMCICWEECECSMLCTRFADLLCPCSEHVVIHEA
jgi:hypothetical protein